MGLGGGKSLLLIGWCYISTCGENIRLTGNGRLCFAFAFCYLRRYFAKAASLQFQVDIMLTVHFRGTNLKFKALPVHSFIHVFIIHLIIYFYLFNFFEVAMKARLHGTEWISCITIKDFS